MPIKQPSMTHQQVIQYVKDHTGGKVKIAFTDIDGVLRGKYISTNKFLGAIEGDTSFCNVIFGWDMADVAYVNNSYTGWHSGYPDAPVTIDLATFRKIPWENDTPFFLGEISSGNNHGHVCPRQLLKKVLGDATALGLKPMFAQEFEWYNFAETPQSIQQKNYHDLTPLTPGMFGYSILRSTLQNHFFADLFQLLKDFDVPLEGLHTETGPGTYEAAIEYADIITAADRAVLFKTAVKEIAYQHGIMATFMAKVNEQLPGCGGHVHQSLWNQQGNNVFYSQTANDHLSDVMKQYIAGQLHCLPHILPMFAPTINSYKRLVEGAWAPTTLTWGIDNRTVALRALPASNTSCRLETRVIGADVNPYLAMAAALASGLYGIKNKLPLHQPPTAGNGYADKQHGILPATLHEAIQAMKQSAVATEILGAGFVQHFVQTREWEWKQHLKAVTNWERQRYFEII